MIYCQAKKGANRMKKIAILMAIIMCTVGLTACGTPEVIDYTVESTSNTVITQTESTTEKPTVPEETTAKEKKPKSEETSNFADKKEESSKEEKSENSGVSENSRVTNSSNTTNRSESSAEHSENKKPEETTKPKPTEKPTQKPTPKPTEKPQEKPDVYKAVSSAISYGCQLGMVYDSSLNTNNASWFSPTNAEYYTTISELTSDCYSDVQYLVNYYGGMGASPSDISFNVVSVGSRIYVVYA